MTAALIKVTYASVGRYLKQHGCNLLKKKVRITTDSMLEWLQKYNAQLGM